MGEEEEGWMDGWALRKWEDWSVDQREGGVGKQEGEEDEGKKQGVKLSKTTSNTSICRQLFF